MNAIRRHLKSILGLRLVAERNQRRTVLQCMCLERRQLMAGAGRLSGTMEEKPTGRPLTALHQDIQILIEDLETIHGASSVTYAEIAAVETDFQSIAAVATRPNPLAVKALAAEIGIIAAQGSFTPAEKLVMAKDVDAVLASANIPKSLAQQTLADMKAVVASSGVTVADVKLILEDVKVVVGDVKNL